MTLEWRGKSYSDRLREAEDYTRMRQSGIPQFKRGATLASGNGCAIVADEYGRPWRFDLTAGTCKLVTLADADDPDANKMRNLASVRLHPSIERHQGRRH
jgi:hypothetical protein